jgi:hypothetical protein
VILPFGQKNFIDWLTISDASREMERNVIYYVEGRKEGFIKLGEGTNNQIRNWSLSARELINSQKPWK